MKEFFPFILRCGTQDPLVWREVYEENEYLLTDTFSADDVVIDIGANIGAFAAACIARGAGRVECYEPEVNNCILLAENLKRFREQVEINQISVWRSDSSDKVYLQDLGGYTAMHRVWPSNNHGCYKPVASISLDDILRRHDRVAMLKLDCEGSEYPILLTADSDLLRRCERIVGEYHSQVVTTTDLKDATPDGIKAKLVASGFEVYLVPAKRDPNLIGHFFARRML